MTTSTVDRLMKFALALFGSLLALTGLVKFGTLRGWFGALPASLPAQLLNTVHDWGGFITVVLAVIFIANRWASKPSDFVVPGRKISWKELRPWVLIILFLVGASAAVFFFRRSGFSASQIQQLKAVEVKDYNGEKLTSIADLPETSIKGPQYVDVANYALEISGLVESPHKLSYAEVLKLPHYSKVVALHCVEGWDANLLWEGVLMKDLLAAAKVRPTANTVIFHAYDGYTTSLSLDDILKNDILLGYKINGVVLPPESGFPFQLVAEDKWGYKWIKWVTKIELSDDPNYRGTWEKAGYSNQGDLSAPMYER